MSDLSEPTKISAKGRSAESKARESVRKRIQSCIYGYCDNTNKTHSFVVLRDPRFVSELLLARGGWQTNTKQEKEEFRSFLASRTKFFVCTDHLTESGKRAHSGRRPKILGHFKNYRRPDASPCNACQDSPSPRERRARARRHPLKPSSSNLSSASPGPQHDERSMDATDASKSSCVDEYEGNRCDDTDSVDISFNFEAPDIHPLGYLQKNFPATVGMTRRVFVEVWQIMCDVYHFDQLWRKEGPGKESTHPQQAFLAVLIRVKTAFPFTMIKNLLGIEHVNISEVFNRALVMTRTFLWHYTSSIIEANGNLPVERLPIFKDPPFDKVAAVGDASSTMIPRPHTPLANRLFFSGCCAGACLKFMVYMNASGLLVAVSPQVYVGSTSDAMILVQDKVAEKICPPGSIFFYDKDAPGIRERLREKNIQYLTPPPKGSDGMSEHAFLTGRDVSSVQSHIERMIGVLKTFNIISGVLDDKEIARASHYLHVAAALTRLKGPLTVQETFEDDAQPEEEGADRVLSDGSEKDLPQ